MRFFDALFTLASRHMFFLLLVVIIFSLLSYSSLRGLLISFSDEDEHIHHGTGYFIARAIFVLLLVLTAVIAGIIFLILLLKGR